MRPPGYIKLVYKTQGLLCYLRQVRCQTLQLLLKVAKDFRYH